MSKLSEEIFALKAKGYTYNQIRESLGCSKGTISYYLGEGQVEKRRARQRKIRSAITDYIRSAKQEAVCSDCGEDYPYWIMEFDHLGDKEFTIGRWRQASASLDKIKAEVAKCDIVCGNCHKNRTYLRLRNNPDAEYEHILDVSSHYEQLPLIEQ